MDLAPETTTARKNGAHDSLLHYGVAVCSVAGGLALRLTVGPVLGPTVPYITFFPAVMLAAWFGGLGPGILAAAVSLLAAYYFALEPGLVNGLAHAAGAILFIAVSVFISVLTEALRHSRARGEERLHQLSLVEEALAESKRSAERERDLLRTTLSSIGDAMISTDAQGRVTFLNAVAEKLTGWNQPEAVGKPISDIFVIRNEKTGLPVESPVEKAIHEGATVGLANGTILTDRTGRRIPIEDSASPIRDGQQRTLGVVLVFRDVTDHRESENAVQRSEERLKLALDAGKIGVWDWDVIQNRIEWSSLVYDIHGVERGAFAGGVDDFARLVHHEDREQVTKAIRDALERGTPYDIEFRVIHPDGKIHWVSTTAQVFRNEKNEPIRMLGAATDVTSRKEAEAYLLRQWHTFDTALSNTPDFTYIFDLNGCFTYINRALLSLWQKPLEDAVGKNFFDLGYPPELAACLQRQIQQVIHTKEPLRDDTPYTGPTGETRHYEYIFVPVFAAGGEVESVAGSTRDVTERNRAAEALRESQNRLRAIFDGTYEYSGLLAPDGTLLEANRAALAFAHNSRADVVGRPCWEMPWFAALPGAPEAVRQALARAAAGEFVRFEATVRRPSGEPSTFDISFYPVLNQRGEVVLIVPEGREITALKQVEQELRESNQELKRVNRELEEFAYVASHDLQEPLRTVNIYTQLILRETAANEGKLGQYVAYIQQGVTRMEALITDLLTFSRAVYADEAPAGVADLSLSLREALSLLKDEIEANAAVITADSLPTAPGDTSQMTHVFQNLLSNALKYRKKDVPPLIHVSVKAEAGHLIVSVRDNGIGFDQRYAERIFGLFKRLHTKEYPGTGMGLPICKRIVERYGGRIWAESSVDSGAAFHFSFSQSAP
jgi:PAS domain S-box-containing protein